MSLGIGLITSNDIDISILDTIREKYRLGLFKIENEYLSNQLLEDEIFFQATITGCDTQTGIGVYELYTKDISKIYQDVKKPEIAQLFVEDFNKRKEIYRNDALQWIDIIKTLKLHYNIHKVAVFIHSFRNSYDQEKINLLNREICNMDNITMEYIMKIQIDIPIFFE